MGTPRDPHRRHRYPPPACGRWPSWCASTSSTITFLGTPMPPAVPLGGYASTHRMGAPGRLPRRRRAAVRTATGQASAGRTRDVAEPGRRPGRGLDDRRAPEAGHAPHGPPAHRPAGGAGDFVGHESAQNRSGLRATHLPQRGPPHLGLHHCHGQPPHSASPLGCIPSSL